MPKMKTNRMAYKKLRVGGTGKAKRAQARTSHNTGKMPSKRVRRLRGRKVVHSTSLNDLTRQLPYAGIKG